MNKSLVVIAITTLLCVNIAWADTAKQEVSAQQRANVNNALEKLSKTTGKTITATDIKISPISGLLQVSSGASVFYVSSDGKYVVAGEMLDVNSDLENWSLTEQAMRALRVQLMAAVAEKDMIIFPAKDNKIGTISVFTDIDCVYCQQMHSYIEEYNKHGIEVRYLAYPRTGPGTESFEKAVSVWCAKDKKAAITFAMQGGAVTKVKCDENPVEMHFELGKQLGVSGTPTLIFSNGAKVPGLIMPDALKDYILEGQK